MAFKELKNVRINCNRRPAGHGKECAAFARKRTQCFLRPQHLVTPRLARIVIAACKVIADDVEDVIKLIAYLDDPILVRA